MSQEAGYTTISAAELKRYAANHRDDEYLVVDVRQPGEYLQGHIPGALHVPLSTLEGRLAELDPEQTHVFYCHSGKRSAIASKLAADSGVLNAEIYNLDGGIAGWTGIAVPETPRLDVFSRDVALEEKLLTAINLEKGAELLYRAVRERVKSGAVCELMETLIPLERKHARAIYELLASRWSRSTKLPEFEALYESMAGDMMEGGRTVAELKPWIEAAKNGCMEFAELALEVEASAYDLYHALALEIWNTQGDKETRDQLLAVAEQEKAHLRLIVSRLDSFLDPLAAPASDG